MDKTQPPDWLKTLALGFTIVSIGIAIAIVGYVLVITRNQTNKQNNRLTPSPTPIQSSPTSSLFPSWASPKESTSTAVISCSNNSDCKNGESCTTVGPIVANQPARKVCVPKGQVAPL